MAGPSRTWAPRRTNGWLRSSGATIRTHEHIYHAGQTTCLDRVKRRTADAPGRVRPPYSDPFGTARASYFAAGAPPGVSLGGTPMTLTPDPRAMSIASITSPYFTFGSPFTKMIFSGRGS